MEGINGSMWFALLYVQFVEILLKDRNAIDTLKSQIGNTLYSLSHSNVTLPTEDFKLR